MFFSRPRGIPDSAFTPQPVEYINAIAAACSSHDGQPIAEGYRYLVQFFNSALLDRTQTLQPGFRYRILDPIPTPLGEGSESTLATLCDEQGATLLAESATSGRPIQFLWSGGIDSTAALVALLKAADKQTDLARIYVYYTSHSVQEYRKFFDHVIEPKLQNISFRSLHNALEPKALIVTGEHGDQLFGSMLAYDYLKSKGWFRSEDARLFDAWDERIPDLLAEKLKSEYRAELALEFLRPQLSRSPIPVKTVFDLLWWINFSMKWQIVTLRMATYNRKHYGHLRHSLRHFFRTEAFQRWSLNNHSKKNWRGLDQLQDAVERLH